MNVIIEGWDIPSGCINCHFFSGQGCKITKKLFDNLFNIAVRPKSCPLRESGHIDTDKTGVLSKKEENILTPREKDYVINCVAEIAEKIRDLQLEIDNLGYFIGDEEYLKKNAIDKN